MALRAGEFILLPSQAAFSLYSEIGAPVTDAYTFFTSFPAGETGMLNGGGSCSGMGGFFDFTGPHTELCSASCPRSFTSGQKQPRRRSAG